MLRRFAGLLTLTFAAVNFVPPAGAQQVLGLGEDASIAPRGSVRLRAAGDWSWFNEQYDSTGARRPLGARFNLDTVGVAQVPELAPLQATLRSLTGDNTISVSLGKTVVSTSGRITTATLGAEFGLARWIQLNLKVPIVLTRTNVFLNTNPIGTEGNVAFNPVLADNTIYAANVEFVNQLTSAARAVQTYCRGAGAGTTPCANATTLATATLAFSAALAQVYDSSTFVPTQQSTIQKTISLREANLRAQLNAFASITGSGVTQVVDTGVVPAPTPIGTSDFQEILADSSYGIGVDSLKTIDRTHLGDVEIGAKILLFDSFRDSANAHLHPSGFNGRFAIGISYRLPTGSAGSTETIDDIQTATHAAALGLRGYLDLLAGSHFWISIAARYDKEQESTLQIRVPGPSPQPFIPFYRTTSVQRTLGNLFELEATPRWGINDFFSIATQYVYSHKPQDQYTGTAYTVAANALTGGIPVLVDPATLNAGTDQTEHKVGIGIAFSDLLAVSQKRASIPLEVSYLHFRTIKGSNVPVQFNDEIQLRLYTALFGH